MEHDYWHKQTIEKPLYPEIEWSKPEQKFLRGKLGIIGGNKLGFLSVAENYNLALETGIGEAKVLLPDILKKTVPKNMLDVIFADTNPSGSLSSDALEKMKAMSEWADGILLIGDTGKNSETAILYENFLREDKVKIVITRDAIDLMKNNYNLLVERKDTLIISSFAQLQKIFQSVYYPKVLTFSMQLSNFIEALHKFTITYPITITTLHKDTLVIAHDGDVVSMPFNNPMQIWRGNTATRASVYWIWNSDKPLESTASSLIK